MNPTILILSLIVGMLVYLCGMVSEIYRLLRKKKP